MDLRLARPDELDAVGEITVAAFASFTRGEADPYVARLRDAASRHREAELWVAARDRDLLGTVTYCPPGSAWRELARDDDGEFRMLSVAPQAQGRGVGTALVRLCEQRARQHGAKAIVISSLPDMAAAHVVYERLGYARRPELDWDPVPGVHLIAFSKALT